MAEQKGNPAAAENDISVDPGFVAKALLEKIGLDEGELANANALVDHFMRGGSLGDLMGMTADDLELVYSFALNYYRGGRNDDAVLLFRFLCSTDPTTGRWWMGLGAARQKSGDYNGAVQAYGMATALDMLDPRPPLQAGYCLMMLGDAQKAEAALEQAQLACGKKTEYAEQAQQAAMLLAAVRQS